MGYLADLGVYKKYLTPWAIVRIVEPMNTYTETLQDRRSNLVALAYDLLNTADLSKADANEAMRTVLEQIAVLDLTGRIINESK